MSILSKMPDGSRFYYGFIKPDMRRIDVRREYMRDWVLYIAGNQIGFYTTKDAAEAAAIAWLKANPEPVDVED
jgi:hypothetical protein